MDLVDEEIFSQLLGMDDEDTPDFSRDILIQYFDQIDTTLHQMRAAMSKKDYVTVSKLGHHIKGSSAGVGAIVVKNIADEIQYYEKHSGGKYEEYLNTRIDQIKPAVEAARTEMSKRFIELGKEGL